MEWKLSLAGLLIGLLVGVTGMGGGSLMTPLLVLFFGFKPSIAIGTDIVHGAIFKSFGAVRAVTDLGFPVEPGSVTFLVGAASDDTPGIHSPRSIA